MELDGIRIYECGEIIQFGLDTGFGEMNSLGFRFMDIRE